MTPVDIDRVFGRSRLRMVTGAHVEVFREASLPGERRRYTKRFLATPAGDFRQWTEREWRILARLVGHGIGPVPDVVQFDRGASDRPALVQTYDAGITVDHWATLLPVERAGVSRRHVFEDCAHWWALACHCLIALDAIHALQLVHLDLKADNVCIPAGPADFDPRAPEALLHLRFEQIALIDFAFSLVSGERLDSALPIARQTEYDYQSPRLLQALEAGANGDLAPTRALDWRCDIFSLAAMLRRYLPDPDHASAGDWTPARRAQACALIRRLLDVHDAELPAVRPHAELIALTSAPLQDGDLAASLQHGWTLQTDRPLPHSELPTPVTRIAMPVATGVVATPVVTGVDVEPITIDASDVASRSRIAARPPARPRHAAWAAAVVALLVLAIASMPLLGNSGVAWRDWIAGFTAAPASGHDVSVASATADAATTPAGASTSEASLPSVGSAPPDSPASVASPASTRAADGSAVQTNPGMVASGDLHPSVPAAASPAAHADGSQTRARASDPAAAPPFGQPTKPAGTAAPPSPAVAARTGRSTTKADGPAQAHRASGKPAHAAMATPRSSAPTRAGSRAAPRTSARFAAADRSKPRFAAAVPNRSGTFSPSTARVASAAAKREGGSRSAGELVASRSESTDVASKAGAGTVASNGGAASVAGKSAPSLAATRPPAPSNVPAPGAAPEPWPHTAMASGMASEKARVDGRRTPDSGPLATAQPVGSPQAFPASPSGTSSGSPSGTFNAWPPAPTPARSATSPPAIPVEPTDPTGPRPSMTAERGRFGAPGLVPSAAVYSPAAESHLAAPPDFNARAGDVMANQLPRLAQRAERSVMRVLFTAARSDGGAQDDEVRQAASAMRRAPDDALADLPLAAADARQLNDAARAAMQRRGSPREAADLQLRAFGANPTDPEVVGNLALLRLKQQPAQAETARQLALHALTLPDPRHPQGRLEDWTTFAIASALGGRERDARNAWWVTATLAPNLQRQCRVATDAYALYGERLRSSVESMLQRLHASGRLDGSPFCAWPPYWTVGSNR